MLTEFLGIGCEVRAVHTRFAFGHPSLLSEALSDRALAVSLPTTTEFYRDLGLLPSQLGEPTLKFGTDLGGLTEYRSDARRQSHQPVKAPEISGT